MAIEDFVTSNITRNTAFPTRKGFGVPLLVVLHTLWADRLRRFRGLAELKSAIVAAGGTVEHILYRMAQAVYAQSPSVKEIVVGARTRSYTQTITLTPVNVTVGYTYRFKVKDHSGLVTSIVYTVIGGDTLTTIGTALAGLLGPIADMTVAAAAGVVTCTSSAGKFTTYFDLPPIADLEVKDTTVDPGLTNDLTDCETAQALTGLSFYGIAVDRIGEAEAVALAAFVQSRALVAVFASSDSEITKSGTTTDVFSDLKLASYESILPLFAQSSTGDFRAAALLGRLLPKDPGSYTAHLKNLVGITADTLSPSEAATVRDKFGTTYTAEAVGNRTNGGKVPSGSYLDTSIGLHFAGARIKENLLGFLDKQDAAPFVQDTIDGAIQTLEATLTDCTKRPNLIFRPGTVNVDPVDVEEVDPADLASRNLPLTWSAITAGAIHTIAVSGTVSLT